MSGLCIALVTDAWAPQVNGVVRTLCAVRDCLEQAGHQVAVISPDQYHSVACPTYPEIRLALARPKSVAQRLAEYGADAIHIATEGPLGLAARRYCLKNGLPFTTAYHTQFPDYLAERTRLPAAAFWPYIRWFHRPAATIMVATETVRRQLRGQGLNRLSHWSRGVDLKCFHPGATPPALFTDLPRPIQLYVGRVSVEKNIEAFLRSDHPGTKIIVGDGPDRKRLEAAYPQAHFTGQQCGNALAGYYAGTDVFVFPSRTDTFGLVLIEALACGTPVAAYPVQGPIDVLSAKSGVMDDNLDIAIARALSLDRADCADHGASFSWEASAGQFLDALAVRHGSALAA